MKSKFDFGMWVYDIRGDMFVYTFKWHDGARVWAMNNLGYLPKISYDHKDTIMAFDNQTDLMLFKINYSDLGVRMKIKTMGKVITYFKSAFSSK